MWVHVSLSLTQYSQDRLCIHRNLDQEQVVAADEYMIDKLHKSFVISFAKVMAIN